MKKISLIVVASVILSLSTIAQATKSPTPSQTSAQAMVEQRHDTMEERRTTKTMSKEKRKAERQEMRNLRKIKKVQKRKERRNHTNVF